MKHNTEIQRRTVGSQTEVCLKSNTSKVVYCFETNKEFRSQFLSDENLSYYIAENDEDEEDDYLLYHALQENKKLCVSFFTRNASKIQDVFKDREKYNIAISPTWKIGYDVVYVSRKGHLSDYFDLDEIDDWYSENGISINDGILEPMFEVEMIEVLSGEYIHPALSVPYNIVIDFAGDDVLRTYGPEGLIISGLLLGYPLEATADLIKSRMEYFITHPRF